MQTATALLLFALAALSIQDGMSFQFGSSLGIASSLSKISVPGQRAVSSRPTLGLRMNMEQVQFVIHSDGRVEEKVTGVKGGKCHEITQEVEELLGKVTYTKPTAELFEEEIQIKTTDQVQDTISNNGGNGQTGGPTNSNGQWSQY